MLKYVNNKDKMRMWEARRFFISLSMRLENDYIRVVLRDY